MQRQRGSATVNAMTAPFGENDALTVAGMPVFISGAVPDGMIAIVNPHALPATPTIHIGVEQMPEHRAEARRIVREGLADVLAWLGEPVEPATPGEQLVFTLKARARTGEWTP
jgi:hypothetical protein